MVEISKIFRVISGGEELKISSSSCFTINEDQLSLNMYDSLKCHSFYPIIFIVHFFQIIVDYASRMKNDGQSCKTYFTFYSKGHLSKRNFFQNFLNCSKIKNLKSGIKKNNENF